MSTGFDWNLEKNRQLAKQRGVSFERVISCGNANGASCRWSDSAAPGAAIGHIFSRSERDVRAPMDERRGTVVGFPDVQEACVALSETCRVFPAII